MPTTPTAHNPSTRITQAEPGWPYQTHQAKRRLAGAALAAFALVLFAAPPAARAAAPGYAANCVNAVLRDAFWGQFRRAIESGGDAADVPRALARAGFAVTDSPSVGAVISWPRGAYGASSSGHVGIVVAVAVRGEGTVLVRHENWPYGSSEHEQVFTVRPGFQFVHRPDALAPAPPDAAPAPTASHPDAEPGPGPDSDPASRGEATAAAGGRVHTVKAGDTLYALALARGTTVDALVAANDLGSSTAVLRIGRRLLIP